MGISQIDEFHRPLGYSQFLQIYVDVMCITHPFVAVYEVSNIIIDNVGYRQYERWEPMPIVLLSSMLYTLIAQGLKFTAQYLEAPLGQRESKHVPGEISFKENFIEVRAILRDARARMNVLFRIQQLSPSYLAADEVRSVVDLPCSVTGMLRA